MVKTKNTVFRCACTFSCRFGTRAAGVARTFLEVPAQFCRHAAVRARIVSVLLILPHRQSCSADAASRAALSNMIRASLRAVKRTTSPLGKNRDTQREEATHGERATAKGPTAVCIYRLRWHRTWPRYRYHSPAILLNLVWAFRPRNTPMRSRSAECRRNTRTKRYSRVKSALMLVRKIVKQLGRSGFFFHQNLRGRWF